LCDVLWGEFALKPKEPGASLRELMTYVDQRYGDRWVIEVRESISHLAAAWCFQGRCQEPAERAPKRGRDGSIRTMRRSMGRVRASALSPGFRGITRPREGLAPGSGGPK